MLIDDLRNVTYKCDKCVYRVIRIFYLHGKCAFPNIVRYEKDLENSFSLKDCYLRNKNNNCKEFKFAPEYLKKRERNRVYK